MNKTDDWLCELGSLLEENKALHDVLKGLGLEGGDGNGNILV